MSGFPSLTKEWHTKSYPAIDPLRPELSAKGKVIAITGGGGAVGSATALAFAKAGASKIAILGRRDKPLQETKAQIEEAVPGTTVMAIHADISNADSVRGAFGNIKKNLGDIDILVCNAGYLSKFEKLGDADPEEWWKGYEINVRGAFNCTRAFLSVAAPRAILVDVSTCVVHMPAMQAGSAYVSSKLAATKIYETFGAENPNLDVTHVHPGVVSSEINAKSGITATDGADLPASFMVWACSDEAAFLRGKYVWYVALDQQAFKSWNVC
jgi:NAD(P)-dependent dehydrogenase (short-subunit alcohol dehydrogenase family)